MRLSALAFALGILLLQSRPQLPPPIFYLSLLALSLLLFAGSRLLRPTGRLLLLAACVAAGFGWAGWRADWRLSEDLPLAAESRDFSVVGVVAELPQAFANGERFVFDVEEAPGATLRIPRRLMLSRYQGGSDGLAGSERLRPGQRWRFTVRLKRPHGNANPHGFDYEAWLLERGIRATGYVRASPAAELLAASVASPGYLLERARDAIRKRFLDTLAGQDYAGILVALTVGDQRAINGEFWQLFARTATTHLMSISGLHVTMIAAFAAWLAGLAWRRSPQLMLCFPAQRAALAVGWLAALFYAFLSGFSVPAQRTLFMLSVAVLALLSARRCAPSRTMALALVLVLLLDPWAVLAPGFWLSFGAVALLFYAAGDARGESPGWRNIISRWGTAQWAVTIGSLPLLLFFFQQFSLVSPLANALAIPAISLVVTPLALLAALVPLPALLHFDHWLLGWVMDFLGWLANYPVLEIAAPPTWSIAIALAGIAWLLLPRGVPARSLGLLLLVPALFSQPPRPLAGQAWVTVLDVGQGLAVVVQTASKTLLYDTGPLYSAESDAGQRIVLPYLRAIGVRALDLMMVTHGDSDHAGGAASILAMLPVRRVLSSVPELVGGRCVAGDSWEWDGVRFRILHPPPGTDPGKRRANHASCVLKIEAENGAVLLTSDIEAADEGLLLANAAAALRADVLLVPHHGSRTSSTVEFVAAVGARQVIYPVGYRNRFGHPREDVVARYGDVAAWRSDLHGAVMVRLEDRVAVDAQRLLHRRYWHGR